MKDIIDAPKDGTAILVKTTEGFSIVRWLENGGGPGVSSDIPQGSGWYVHLEGLDVLDEGWDTGNGWLMELRGTPVGWDYIPT